MTWKPRPGVVLVDVCGVPILTATRTVWEDFPQIVALSGLEKLVWDMTVSDASDGQLVNIVSVLTRTPPDEARAMALNARGRLADVGFLIADGGFRVNDGGVPDADGGVPTDGMADDLARSGEGGEP